MAAAPEGRECVVALGARVSEEADREAVEHLVDTFEADCGAVASEPLPDAAASPSASAPDEPDAPDGPSSASASSSAGTADDGASDAPESSASAQGSASAPGCPPGTLQNAEGTTCTDLDTGEIVEQAPPPLGNPNPNPCPEEYALNEQGLCRQWLFPPASASASASAPPEARSSNPTAGASASPNP